jgi:hypothetical protein
MKRTKFSGARIPGLIAAAASVIALFAGETIDFDAAKPGALPEGWTAGVTGKGTANWLVEMDEEAPSKPNVLKQTGAATFAWCVRKSESIENGFVETRFKPISGKEDQAAGLVWRWQDADTYYIARANALEDNVTIYKVIGGKRMLFKKADVKVSPGQWHLLRVDFKGAVFQVKFDEKQVFEAKDGEITKAGAIGLWTKADSVTAFDNFSFGAK